MISEKVFNKLIDKGLTIAFAESMTGGALTFEMVKYPKASKIVLGSITAYNLGLKKNLLGVNEKTINTYSVVSQEVADEMAFGILKHTQADICISITGNAGPSLEKNTKDQIAYYTILLNQVKHQFKIDLTSSKREKNILFAINHIYQNLYQLI
jgi:nicotinamide-nucleotide amidase